VLAALAACSLLRGDTVRAGALAAAAAEAADADDARAEALSLQARRAGRGCAGRHCLGDPVSTARRDRTLCRRARALHCSRRAGEAADARRVSGSSGQGSYGGAQASRARAPDRRVIGWG